MTERPPPPALSLPPLPPPLSVVMPVHNALPFLDAAIDSILAQDFGDFEFVIHDDGSTDGSGERLRDRAARDARIRLIGDGNRHGPAGSSNRIVAAARAPLIARMDADDVARPDRLRHALDALAARPEAVMVGSLFDLIDERGRHVRDAPRPAGLDGALRPPFCHSSILFRRDAFDRIGGYRAVADRWEDLDFFLRMAGAGDVLVLSRVLMDYRLSGSTTSARDGDETFERATDLATRCLARFAAVGEYETLLAATPETPPRRLEPMVFVSGGAMALWRGRRPGALGKLLRRADLAPRPALFKALAWSIAAELSPRGLRWLLRRRLAWRNRAIGETPPVLTWRPPFGGTPPARPDEQVPGEQLPGEQVTSPAGARSARRS